MKKLFKPRKISVIITALFAVMYIMVLFDLQRKITLSDILQIIIILAIVYILSSALSKPKAITGEIESNTEKVVTKTAVSAAVIFAVLALALAAYFIWLIFWMF